MEIYGVKNWVESFFNARKKFVQFLDVSILI